MFTDFFDCLAFFCVSGPEGSFDFLTFSFFGAAFGVCGVGTIAFDLSSVPESFELRINARSFCLSSLDTKSSTLVCERPAAIILSRRTCGSIFRISESFFTDISNYNSPQLNHGFLASIIRADASFSVILSDISISSGTDISANSSRFFMLF